MYGSPGPLHSQAVSTRIETHPSLSLQLNTIVLFLVLLLTCQCFKFHSHVLDLDNNFDILEFRMSWDSKTSQVPGIKALPRCLRRRGASEVYNFAPGLDDDREAVSLRIASAVAAFGVYKDSLVN